MLPKLRLSNAAIAGLASAFLSVTVVCSTTLSMAVSPDKAEVLIQEGIELRRAGKDADAVLKFEKAFAISKSPRAGAQLGLCYQAISRWSEADPLLADALMSSSDPWVKKNRQVLRDSIEQLKIHLARIEVLGQPEGAAIAINGQPAGTLPLKQAAVVNEGPVEIEVSYVGYQPEIRKLTASGASYQRLVFRLQKEKGAPPIALNALPAGEVSLPPAQIVAETPGTLQTSGSNRWLWGGAAVVLTAAAVLTVFIATSSGSSSPYADNTFKFE